MIKKPTTLILGAGASKDYGFPLGRELVDIILGTLENPVPSKLGLPGIHSMVAELGHTDPKEIGEFAANLRDSNLDSIDEFLSKQPRFIGLAKKCIAYVLIPYENPSITRAQGWYRFLINQLFSEIQKRHFRLNELSVITFNYDRSLEYYLYSSFRGTFGVTDAEAMQNLGFIDIVHVYGQLAQLGGTGSDSRVFDPNRNAEFVRRAAEQIFSGPGLSLTRQGSEEIATILKLKENRVYFLGFGYNAFNLNVLRFDEYSFPQVLGTSIGLGKAQKETISKRWNIGFPDSSKSILDFIKDFAPLD